MSTVTLSSAPERIAQDQVRLLEVPLDSLQESPDNPRTHFDAEALEQLKESLSRSGMLTPIRVRSLAPDALNLTAPMRYVIAAGHRRYRAAKALGWATVPVLASPMTDAQFLEVLTVDNLQRDDLHPLEEAQGFALLLRQLGYDIAAIGHRLGRSQSYVYDRLRLLKLTPAARELFAGGHFPLSHAIVLSRLGPDAQALVIGTPADWYQDGGLFREDRLRRLQEDLLDEADDSPAHILSRLTVKSLRELEGWIEDHVRFDRAAEDLPELFPETAEAIAAAEAAKGKVVPITFDHVIRDSARADERTLGPRFFREASGRGKDTPTCEHSVLGVVVVGHRRGESFPICLAKEKCTVHYAKEIREKRKREKERAAAEASGAPAPSPAAMRKAQEERARREGQMRDALELRIRKAKSALHQACDAAVQQAPLHAVIEVCALRCAHWDEEARVKRWLASEARGLGAEEALRFLATLMVRRHVGGAYSWPDTRKSLQRWGVDAQAVLDAAAPPAPEATPAKKAQKPRAGAVRRKTPVKAGR